jgi:hypothetical protein
MIVGIKRDGHMKQLELLIVVGREVGHADAPAHYANIVREFLDETFPRRWIGRNGRKQWPPRSPDLRSLVFVFGMFLQQIICSIPMHNIQRLKQRIRNAASSVTHEVLGQVWQEIKYRLDVCRATNEAHIAIR